MRSALSDYKRTAPVSPTGPTRDEEKDAARAHRAAVIADTRHLVFARDRLCRCCGRPGCSTDEMHEMASRAQLRGKPPEEVFTTRNCLRLCRDCHHDVTQHRKTLIPRTEAGADGVVDVVLGGRAA